jgi:hypothetical protein
MHTILLPIFILLDIQVIACYDSNYLSFQYTSINCDQNVQFSLMMVLLLKQIFYLGGTEYYPQFCQKYIYLHTVSSKVPP